MIVPTKSLIGRKIVEARNMNDKEMENFEDWFNPGMVLFLDDGAAVIVAQDEELNGPGALYYVKDKREGVVI